MLIFPAIDIQNGECVRLYQGDFATAQKVAENPLETALAFCEAGASWIHMVDLDGAVQGTRVNSPVFLEIAAKSGLFVELGGGIRTMQDIAYYIDNGISRVILGSVALKNAELVREAVRVFGENIAVGIDARDGIVMAEGWVEGSGVGFLDLARRMEQAGVKTLIYTDISRDGMLQGPNLEQLSQFNKAVSCEVIASGGVTTLEDVTALRDAGLYGAICGRSLYAGTLNLRDAIIMGGSICRSNS